VEEFQISGYIKFPYPIFDYDTHPIWLICIFMAAGVVLFIGIAILLRFIFQRKKKALAG
jgi:predicted permease